jgi:hypothetical protein
MDTMEKIQKMDRNIYGQIYQDSEEIDLALIKSPFVTLYNSLI